MLLEPPPPTPEGEAAALLLYLGLPATAVFGSPQPVEPAPRSEWVWWVWGRYPSKRALIPSAHASRLVELHDPLKSRHSARAGARLAQNPLFLARAKRTSLPVPPHPSRTTVLTTQPAIAR